MFCFSFSNKNTYYKMTSVRKLYTFQNLLKIRTLIPAEKFGNINLYQQTVLLKTIYDFIQDLNFFYGRIEVFDFKKTPFRYIFNYNKCILVRLWVKVLVSKGWVQSEITAQTL